MENRIFTVKEITRYIKSLLANDNILNDLWITGEISNFYHHNSGHMYFTIKDDHSQLKSIMFKSNNQHLKFKLEEGLKVTAHGYIDVYANRGDYQFYIDKIEPEGMGSLYLAFEQLKGKLEKEGLFNQEIKKEIPLLPSKIGIVTSPTGAAIRDILSVVNRRFENVSILIIPSLVQGDKASDQIVQGIEYLNSSDDVDLIIISRGGGSIEDLWPFNEEIVARAIYQSDIPVISGVGHETDFTIADFVADLRAPTPSAAAELAIANRLELEKDVENFQSRLYNTIQNKIENYREKINSIMSKRIFSNPEELFSRQIQIIDDLSKDLKWSIEKSLNHNKEKLNILSGKLETLSPLKTLKRGYSISSIEGKITRKIDDVNIGERLTTRLTDGIIYSQIQDLKKVGDPDGE